jgi:hypothetical protein
VASVHVICSKYSFRFVLLSCITCGFVTESWFPFLVLFAWCVVGLFVVTCCVLFLFAVSRNKSNDKSSSDSTTHKKEKRTNTNPST